MFSDFNDYLIMRRNDQIKEKYYSGHATLPYVDYYQRQLLGLYVPSTYNIYTVNPRHLNSIALMLIQLFCVPNVFDLIISLFIAMNQLGLVHNSLVAW